MSKINLQNVSSMNQGLANGPMDGEINLDESGVLDDSGLMDDSGILNDFTPGYDFMTLIHVVFHIRFFIWWYQTLVTAGMKIVDDEYPSGFEVSGDMGVPVENTDEYHYELHYVTQGNVYTSGINTISSTVTIDYTHYPCGRDCIDEGCCKPVHCHVNVPVVYNIPNDYYLKGIDEGGTSNP